MEGKISKIISGWRSESIWIRRGETIESVDDIPKGIYIIKTGIVKLDFACTGHTHLVSLIGQDSFFGLNCLYSYKNLFSYAAFTDVAFSFISQESAKSEEHNYCSYAGYLDVSYLKQKVIDDSHANSEGRIVNFLTLVDKVSKNQWVRITRKEIAEFSNCGREHASRILLQLEKNGLISIDGHQLKTHSIALALKRKRSSK
jgi:CRP-like cAMP-binding protein